MFNFLPTLPQLIAYGIILLTCFPIHEFAHAFVADRFGDTTPRANGRLTLNPLAHLDPMGSLLMIVAGFGWAKPVPINPRNLSRAETMLVSLAGPCSNLLMAILAAIPFRLGLVSTANIYQSTHSALPNITWFLFVFIFTNLWLMLFNLIPIAPLDGEKVLDYFLPPAAARAFETIRPYGPIILLAIIFVLPLVGINLIASIIDPVFTALTRVLIGR